MTDIAARGTPYKGLVPYDESDAPFFFGREAEREIIAANLMGSRLTLVYGPSGVGKSSVLRAGVVHDLQKMALEESDAYGNPKFVMVFFNAWRDDDPLGGLLSQVRARIAEICEDQIAASLESAASFGDTLKLWTESAGVKLLIILDQFEEYFLYSQDGTGSFAEEFPAAVNRADVRANFIISLREDWYTKLDRFKVALPNIFDNNLRIEWLDHEAARLAIEEPVKLYDKVSGEGQPKVTIAPGFSESVLRQLEMLSEKDVLGDSGSGEVKSSAVGRRAIQTPYLQLVMTRLWVEANQSQDHTLSPRMLEKPHDATKAETRAEEIIQSHLDGVMKRLNSDDQNVAAEAFYHLVTPGGTKIAQQIGDLKGYTGFPEGTLNRVLEKLSSKEMSILSQLVPPPNRPVNQVRYEVSHDVLAPAILAWRKNYMLEKDKEEAARRAAAEAAAVAEKTAAEAAAREIETQRELEFQRQLTTKQRRIAELTTKRADEQASAARRLRVAIVLLAVVTFISLSSAVYAVVKKKQADRARTTDELYRQAFSLSRRGDTKPKAIEKFKEALKVYDKHDQQAAIDTRLAVGEIYSDLNDEKAASDSFESALAMSQGDTQQAVTNTSVGDIYREMTPWRSDRRDEALEKYKAAAKVYENRLKDKPTEDDKRALAGIRFSMGQVYAESPGQNPTEMQAYAESPDKKPTEIDEGLESFRKAKDMFKEVGDHENALVALIAAGEYAARDQKTRQEADRFFEEALGIYHDRNVVGEIEMLERMIGLKLSQEEDPTEVAVLYLRLITIYQKTHKDRPKEASALADLARAYTGKDPSRYREEIIKHLQGAQKIYREIGDYVQSVELLKQIANHQMDVGDEAAAIETSENALAVARKANVRLEIQALTDLTRICASARHEQKANSYLQESIEKSSHLSQKSDKIFAALLIGEGHLNLKDSRAADKSFERAVWLAQQSEDLPPVGPPPDSPPPGGPPPGSANPIPPSTPDSPAQVSERIGGIYARHNANTKALSYFSRAADLYKTKEDSSSRSSRATVLVRIGDIYVKQKDLKKAIETYEQALPVACESGSSLAALQALATAYHALGNIKEAKEYEQRAAQESKKNPFLFDGPQVR